MSFFSKFFGNKNSTNGNGSGPHPHPEIKVSDKNEGSHGDRWACIFGSRTLAADASVLMNLLQTGLEGAELVMDTGDVKVLRRTLGDLELWGIIEGERLITFVPYVRTLRTLPLVTKEIAEWTHTQRLEAQVKGAGRGEFGLSFLAVDYAVNRNRYLSDPNQQVYVNGLALVLQPASTSPMKLEGGAELSPNFCGYMWNSDHGAQSVIDIIGEVEAVRRADMPDGIQGYILTTRLINHDTNSEFFKLDIFVNPENASIGEPFAGMRVSGMIWLTGQLAAQGIS